MSIITKLFVILVTVLSVALAALIVPFVANTENYRDQIEELERQVAAAKAAARVSESQLKDLMQQESERVTALNAEKAVLTAEINRLKNTLATAEQNLQAEQNKLARFEADWSRLTAINQQNSQLVASLQQELSDRRTEVVDFRTKWIEQKDANTELASARDSLEQQVRFLKEQATEQDTKLTEFESIIAKLPPEQLDSLRDGGVAGGSDLDGSRPYVPPFKVSGQVTRVERVGDDTYVQVNVGRNDKVERNMQFYVHRGTRFLGNLIVTAVDSNTAAGRITLSQGVEIAAGDRVQTGGVGQ